MILTWCLYAVVVALLATAAAAAAERCLRLVDRPARWAWLAAMALSVGLPLGYVIVVSGGGPPPQPVVPADLPVIELRGLTLPAAPASPSPGPLELFAAAMPWLWAGASLLLAVWLVRSKLRLRESEAGWRPASTAFAAEGPVYRTETFGPAVVGFARPRIVLPDWVAQMGAERRELVMLHEQEHLRCRDPILVLAGWIFLVAVPWLFPLWWQFRRLRMAIEKDCDRRVVDRTGDARRYGRLLLEAEELAGGLAQPLVTSGGSFLGDRIRSLVEEAPPYRGLRAAGAAVGMAAALLVVGMVPPPGMAEAMAGPEAAERALYFRGPVDEFPTPVDEERLAMRARDAFRASGLPAAAADTMNVRVHVAADGTVDGAYLAEYYSDRSPALRRAALQVAAGTLYEPATRDGEPVAIWVATPIPFSP